MWPGLCRFMLGKRSPEARSLIYQRDPHPARVLQWDKILSFFGGGGGAEYKPDCQSLQPKGSHRTDKAVPDLCSKQNLAF